MELERASKTAGKIVDALRPLCQNIEIAGSIRRFRPQVNDIDLVIMASDINAVKNRCQQRCTLIADGMQNASFRLSTGLQLDLFFARGPLSDLIDPKPSNWGSILLCRTGSAEHNKYLCSRAKSFGLTWSYPDGVKDPEGYVIAAETEKSVYESLGFPYIPPHLRELDYMIKHFGSIASPRPPVQNAPVPPPAAEVKPPVDPEATSIALAQFHAFGESLKS